HCTPLAHALNAVVYEAMQVLGRDFNKNIDAALPADLARFRHISGPPGHIESCCALADASTGSSGHGFSSALGIATLHKSCGLGTKVFVVAGDAETEEGMSYEARNLAVSMGMDNITVMLDWNGFGIDGPITEVISTPFINHWFGLGWNVIEVDGHNFTELMHAQMLADQGFGNKKPTVIIAKTIKGKFYGKLAGTSDSHGTPASQEDYVKIMREELGFNIPGVAGDTNKDIEVIMAELKKEDAEYLLSRIAIKKIKPEAELVEMMKNALSGREMVDYRSIKRPAVLPPELIFTEGEKIPTRKATEAWYKWIMQRTAFFYLGSGDLMKSILTGAAEDVYGVINNENPLGRGVRFGIAEQNMAMMSTALTQDILPGDFKAMSVFCTYGVFTSIMSNAVRMALLNNHVNPKTKGFFIMMAAHDGPETGEDGPTHHGLFWMSLFDAYPGIKVYKPMDANETVEMLFYAMEKGEPIALSIMRPPTLVFKRGNGIPPAREAINGAYVFKEHSENGMPKIVMAICGGQVMANIIELLPELEAEVDVKLVAVTSPELFEELRVCDPAKAESIFSYEELDHTLALHNGWPGFLYPFMLPKDHAERVVGISNFLKSGTLEEVYAYAGFDTKGLRDKIQKYIKTINK
ncbi:MAG: 1-deoxy-D-xylulose-5-phosphate synthase N-terminal domain-containing protein, partial [Candidatus Yanofskybacteria bacterium]|nr:1-deoxy-D-xylulose-5-phosphate synthase N-terminal domain-containing protein [Candidatus Yanofskybacteria bacterium]